MVGGSVYQKRLNKKKLEMLNILWLSVDGGILRLREIAMSE